MRKILLILILCLLTTTMYADTINLDTMVVKDLRNGEIYNVTPFEKIAIPVIIEKQGYNSTGNFVYYAKNQDGKYIMILRI